MNSRQNDPGDSPDPATALNAATALVTCADMTGPSIVAVLAVAAIVLLVALGLR